MEVRPFRAKRPAPGYERRVAALPYDVVDVARARELVAAEPMSFLAVDLPELAFADDVDPLAPAVFHRARTALARLDAAGAFVEDEDPALYVYQLAWRGHVQTGLVGCFAVDDYLSGTIAKHEVTRAEKEEGRVRHIRALDAQTGLVFLTYRAAEGDALARALAEVAAGEPLYGFVDAHGVGNRLWRVDGEAMRPIQDAVGEIERAYIADGHHRAAAASRHALERRAAHAEGEGASHDAPHDYFMAGLYPDRELTVLAYHRVVADRAGLSKDELLDAVREVGYRVAPVEGAPHPAHPGEIGLFTDGSWWLLEDERGAAGALDVDELQERVLGPVLGIGDAREDPRISFIGGNEDGAALEAAAGAEGVAFLLRPTEVAQLMAVADAGETMPPKSTWFEPKLRSGLLLHPLS